SGLLTAEMNRGAGARPRSRAGAGTADGGGGSRRGRSSPGATGEIVSVSVGGGNSTGRGGPAAAPATSSAVTVRGRAQARPFISASSRPFGLGLGTWGVPWRRRRRGIKRGEAALGPAHELRVLTGGDDLAVRALGALLVGRGLQRGGEARQPFEVPLGGGCRFRDHGVVSLCGLRVAAQLERALPDEKQRIAPLLALQVGHGLGGLE